MKPQCGTKGAQFKHHDGEMVQVHDIGDNKQGESVKQIEYLCLRCGHRWWVEMTARELDRAEDNERDE